MEKPESDTLQDSETQTLPLTSAEERLVLRGTILAQRGLLIVAGLMTLIAAGVEIAAMIDRMTVTLGDILLVFLYAEVMAMVAVFYSGRGLPLVYPIFVAITALARLIVLQGKDMNPTNIVLEAGAILLLAIAAVLLLRLSRQRQR